MLSAILSGIWPYIVGLLTVAATLFAARRSGRQAEKRKQLAESTAKRLKAMLRKSEIEKDVDNEDRDSVIDINTRP